MAEENIWSFDATKDPFGYVYEALADHLTSLIKSGRLPAGSSLPSERKLAQLCDVSLGTARHATSLLRVRGLAVTVRSKGTFVASDADRSDGSRLTLINGEPTGW